MSTTTKSSDSPQNFEDFGLMEWRLGVETGEIFSIPRETTSPSLDLKSGSGVSNSVATGPGILHQELRGAQMTQYSSTLLSHAVQPRSIQNPSRCLQPPTKSVQPELFPPTHQNIINMPFLFNRYVLEYVPGWGHPIPPSQLTQHYYDVTQEENAGAPSRSSGLFRNRMRLAPPESNYMEDEGRYWDAGKYESFDYDDYAGVSFERR